MSKRKKLFVALASVAVLVLGGIAYAAWTADGSGTGKAHARDAIVVGVNAATGTADLYPGVTDGDIHFTLDNDNPYAVTFTGFTAGMITSSAPVACPASLVTVDDTSPISVPVAVAAGASGSAGEIDGVVSLDHAALDGCQGVTFDIDLTLTGSQD
ncbi:MAG TPA: hypothetical protein VGN51_10385 [Acidimicrobiia bacterium]|jgi:hypothetical protein